MPGVRLQTWVAGVMIAQLTAGMATRDALFLSHYPPTLLPYVMGVSAVLSLIAVSVFSRLLVRWGPDRVVPAAFTLNAMLFVGEWAITGSAPAPAAVMTFLHTMVLGAVLVSGFWSLMTERFDPHSAKKVFGRIGAGGSIGGVLGAIGAGQAATVVSIDTMLLLLAALNIVCVVSLGRARGPRPSVDDATTAAPRGFGPVYLRHLAVLVVVVAIADVSLEYVFKARAADALPAEDLIGFFALFYAIAGVVSFLLQALVARALLQNVGLTATLACQPIAAALGSVVAIAVPGMWAMTFVRAGDSALRTSLFKAGYELLYTPLRPEHKRAVKTKIDVGFSRLGGFAGSALVLAAIELLSPGAALSFLLVVAATVSVGAAALVALLHRGYVSALADSLVHSAIKLDPEDVEDATTRKTLAATTMGIDHALLVKQISTLRPRDAAKPDELVARVETLRSTDDAKIREVLAGDLDAALVPFVLPLLTRDELVEDTTRALRAIAPRITGVLVDALLDSASHGLVRRRVPRVLVASVTQRSVDGLVLGLAVDSYDVRHRCALALERLAELGPTLVIDRAPIFAAVRAETQRLGGEHDRERLGQIFLLLGLVLDRRPLKLAHRALASGDGALRGTGLEYLENVLPAEILEPLKPHLGASDAPRAPQRPVAAIAKVLVESMQGVDVESRALEDETA